MNNLTTPRLGLPLLAAGQAHKELFHNEAIARLDILSSALVWGVENDPGILSPLEGQSWIVGTNPVGQWSDHANALAGWTGGGWRFIQPVAKMSVKIENSDNMLVFREGEWNQSIDIASPQGGSVIDVEARSAIDSILLTLKQAGIVSYSTE